MRRFGVVLFFAVLPVFYLWPAFTPVLTGDLTHVMSDGTDSATLPYMYGALRETLSENPGELFYGAVPSRHLNAPQGLALWIPWSERSLALFASGFVPLEHVSTVYVALLMFLNALCMYGLGRYLGWPQALSLAMAIAWAFCPFTRARAQVHAGFAGTYHVPLVFLSCLWALNGSSRRTFVAALSGFLAVAMAPHYFVITLAFLMPFWLGASWLLSEKKNFKRLILAALPALALLAWCFIKPLPTDLVTAGAAPKPPSGETEGGEPHLFLNRYAARSIDYFTGDIALGTADINPLRAMLTEHALTNLGGSNPHERANGVRWLIWLMVVIALARTTKDNRASQAALVMMGAFAFWLSMPPPGPSYWLYSTVSQIRVPSRAGIFVHFAAILVAGQAARTWNKKVLLALPFLFLLELPPGLQSMRISRVRPALTSLAGDNCGAGMYYPYVAGNWGVLEDYHFLQELRGTRCGVINRQWPDAGSEKMYQAMGLSVPVLNAFNAQDPPTFRRLNFVADCAGLSFIVFDPRTTTTARAKFCAEWGGQISEPRVCKKGPRALLKNPAECL